ncbi:MAG TPA: hypothetical protein VJC39_02790 [Candidatus Nanoarchaeia archaeon]|nr:hypothetical protein [Candidatus Nanoarchaeia archaeon]
MKLVQEQKIPSLMLYLIEVYITPESAAQEGSKVDLSQKFVYSKYGFTPLSKGAVIISPEFFFSSKYYEIADLTDLEEEEMPLSFSTMEHLVSYLKDKKIKKINYPSGPFKYWEDFESLFLYRGLHQPEIKEILDYAKKIA